jgi:hypothetical protein
MPLATGVPAMASVSPGVATVAVSVTAGGDRGRSITYSVVPGTSVTVGAMPDTTTLASDAPVHVSSIAVFTPAITPVSLCSVHGRPGSTSSTVYESRSLSLVSNVNVPSCVTVTSSVSPPMRNSKATGPSTPDAVPLTLKPLDSSSIPRIRSQLPVSTAIARTPAPPSTAARLSIDLPSMMSPPGRRSTGAMPKAYPGRAFRQGKVRLTAAASHVRQHRKTAARPQMDSLRHEPAKALAATRPVVVQRERDSRVNSIRNSEGANEGGPNTGRPAGEGRAGTDDLRRLRPR